MEDKINFKVQEMQAESVFNKELIIIRLGKHRIGIQINYLREVFDIKSMNDVIGIPFTPSFIKGIIKLRGDILPVISLLEFIETGEHEENCLKIAVIEDRIKLAFLFHEVLDVKLVDDAKIEPVKDATKLDTDNLLTGQFKWGNEKVYTLDVYKLLSSEIFK